MRFFAIGCLGLFLLIGQIGSTQAQSWTEVRPEGGRYLVLMPGTPRASTETVDEHWGRPISMHMTTSATEYATYSSAYVDLPRVMISAMRPDRLLDEIRDGMREDSEDSVRGERRVSIAGHPGRELVMDHSDDQVSVTRIFLVGNRFYRNRISYHRDSDMVAEARRFLDSFTLIAESQR